MSETLTETRARILAILQSGVQSDSRDGASTTFNHDILRKQLHDVEVKLGIRRKRSRLLNYDMSRR